MVLAGGGASRDSREFVRPPPQRRWKSRKTSLRSVAVKDIVAGARFRRGTGLGCSVRHVRPKINCSCRPTFAAAATRATRVVVGRSKSTPGPYLNRNDKLMSENGRSLVGEAVGNKRDATIADFRRRSAKMEGHALHRCLKVTDELLENLWSAGRNYQLSSLKLPFF